MARIRTIKPEFWTDRRVGECSPNARLLFIATFNFADDHGGLDRSAKQLKAQAFPYDNTNCEPLVQELIEVGLLIEYEVRGDKYLHIKNFRKHQRIDKPQAARIPIYDDSTNDLGKLAEGAETIQRSKGMEGNGRDRKEETTAAAQPARRRAALEASSDAGWFLDFKSSYPPRNGAQPWDRARKAANARIAAGHTTDDFIAGAQRYAAYCEATGKTGTEYVQQAATFLGPDKPFLLPWNAPADKNQRRQDANISASRDWLENSDAA